MKVKFFSINNKFIQLSAWPVRSVGLQRRANIANVAGMILVLAIFLFLVSIMVSIPDCHAGNRRSIPRQRFYFWKTKFIRLTNYFTIYKNIFLNLLYQISVNKTWKNLNSYFFVRDKYFWIIFLSYIVLSFIWNVYF